MFYIKGLNRSRNGQNWHTFTLDEFRGENDAIDTAKAVADSSDYNRVMVVDDSWTYKNVEGPGVVWDSDKEGV